jgi:hypothetical protein
VTRGSAAGIPANVPGNHPPHGIGEQDDDRPRRDPGHGDDLGVLRIDFPGGAGEDQLEDVSWDDWFDKFEENDLAFLYQEKKASGEDSTFFKLVKR